MPKTTRAGTKNRPPASSKELEEHVDLNEQQKMFARCYLNGFTVMRDKYDDQGNIVGKYPQKVRMGNGVKSYAFAYGYFDQVDADFRTYESCMTQAARLLRNVKIEAFLDDLKIANGWHKKVADNVLIEIMTLGKDENRIKAMQEFNKLEGRITEKAQIEGNINVISAIPRPKRSEDVDNG
jgi:hypothetical protein